MSAQLSEHRGVRVAIEGCVSSNRWLLDSSETHMKSIGPWRARRHILIDREGSRRQRLDRRRPGHNMRRLPSRAQLIRSQLHECT